MHMNGVNSKFGSPWQFHHFFEMLVNSSNDQSWSYVDKFSIENIKLYLVSNKLVGLKEFTYARAIPRSIHNCWTDDYIILHGFGKLLLYLIFVLDFVRPGLVHFVSFFVKGL